MSDIPKVLEVHPESDLRLHVVFDNGVEKIYDCNPVIERFSFQPLRNDSLFKSVHIDPGGYGISWNAEIDLSEYELWTNGSSIEKYKN
jgi:hypothetical protein